jgi:hypothetical protein
MRPGASLGRRRRSFALTACSDTLTLPVWWALRRFGGFGTRHTARTGTNRVETADPTCLCIRVRRPLRTDGVGMLVVEDRTGDKHDAGCAAAQRLTADDSARRRRIWNGVTIVSRHSSSAGFRIDQRCSCSDAIGCLSQRRIAQTDFEDSP